MENFPLAMRNNFETSWPFFFNKEDDIEFASNICNALPGSLRAVTQACFHITIFFPKHKQFPTIFLVVSDHLRTSNLFDSFEVS